MNNAKCLKRFGIAGLAAGTALAFSVSAIAAPVTYERLLEAETEAHNWLLPYGSYNNHNHSSLSQINRSNVADLQVKFMFAIGGVNEEAGSRFQATPAVNNGFMYISNPWGKIFKVDVRSGRHASAVWVNDLEPEKEGRRMRGSTALLDNYVYALASRYDARMAKIDADSGETVWEISTLAPVEEAGREDQRHSVQPIAVKNMLIQPQTGTVRRDSVTAYNADDGAMMWRFWTIPGPGEPGHETWADNWDAYMTGGAAIWTQGAFDPDTNLIVYGTGEPSPWYDPEFRPGDNLYTVSNIAINVDTGELGWYFQEIPDESWDYDTVNPKMLYDIDGQTVMGTFSRNGYYYTLDGTNGDFLYAETYTFVNWTAGLDPKTGMPVEYDPNVQVQEYAPGKSIRAGQPETSQNVCPNFYGMPTLMPPTYDKGRMVAYVGAQESCFSQSLAEGFPKESHVGGRFGGLERFINGQTAGTIWAVDVLTGSLTQKRHVEYGIYSGTLGTAGDLLFIAQADGTFSAFDKDTLSELWSFNTGTGMSAPPITYSVDGVQYVAILAGGQNLKGLTGRPEIGLLEPSPSVIVFGL